MHVQATKFVVICYIAIENYYTGFQIPHLIKCLMKGVKGVEFSSYVLDGFEKINVHILGYCFNENNPKFLNILKELKEKRNNKHIELLKNLKSNLLSIPENSIEQLNMDRYCWFDRDVIACFEKERFPKETIDKLKTYYKNNRFSYGQDYSIDARKVIDAIHSAGGYAVFAHPMAYQLPIDKVLTLLKRLKEYGIDGIESYQSDCSLEDTQFLLNYSDKNELLNSAGSDFHKVVSSDNRTISYGINHNLCVEQTSLADEIIDNDEYFKKKC